MWTKVTKMLKQKKKKADSRVDWSFICHSQSQKVSKCSFSPLPDPFFSLQSFICHPLRMCDRFQTHGEGETMCCDPQYRPPAQSLASTPSPSRLRGAWPPPSPALPPSLPPESIVVWHRTNDLLRSMHHRAVHHQQWPAMWFRWESACRTRSYCS